MLKNKRNKKKQLNSYIRYSSLTTQMAAIIAVGTFFGNYLDQVNNTNSKTYTITLSLISIFLALYYVIKKIINQNEKK